MKKLIPFLLLFAACQKETLEPPSAIVDSAAHVNGSESFPVEFITFDSCTNEDVVISAVLEYKYNIVQNKDDLFATACYSYKGGRGVGQTSGDEYKLIGRVFDITRVTDFDGANIYNVRIRSKLTFQTKGGINWVVEGTYRLYSEGWVIKTLVEEENSFCK